MRGAMRAFLCSRSDEARRCTCRGICCVQSHATADAHVLCRSLLPEDGIGGGPVAGASARRVFVRPVSPLHAAIAELTSQRRVDEVRSKYQARPSRVPLLGALS